MMRRTKTVASPTVMGMVAVIGREREQRLAEAMCNERLLAPT